MIELSALKMLVLSELVICFFCATRSAAVLATEVTFCRQVSASHNSTTPRNRTTITGAISANSTAARPLFDFQAWARRMSIGPRLRKVRSETPPWR